MPSKRIWIDHIDIGRDYMYNVELTEGIIHEGEIGFSEGIGPELSTVQEIWQSKPGSQHSGSI